MKKVFRLRVSMVAVEERVRAWPSCVDEPVGCCCWVDLSIWVWGIGGEALEARGRQRPEGGVEEGSGIKCGVWELLGLCTAFRFEGIGVWGK